MLQQRKIACVVPPYYRLIESKNNRLTPAMHYVAEILHRRGHDVVLINGDYGDKTVDYSDRYSMTKNSWLFEERYRNGHVSYDTVISALRQFQPQFVVIGAGDPLLPTVEVGCSQSCAYVARRVKEVLGKDVVCIGYGHLLKHAAPEDLQNLDVVISSEAEEQIIPVIEEGLRGVLEEVWLQDMRKLPILTDSYLYFPAEAQDWDYIMSSRGCPNHCKFCYQPALRNGVLARRPVEEFIKEIRYRMEHFGTRGFYIADMIFSSGEGEDYWQKLQYLQAIKNENPDFTWWAEFYVKGVQSAEVVDRLKASGCVHMKFGVEMGSQAMLDRMQKRITLDEIRRAFALAADAGIKRTAYILLGCPGFTDKDYQEMWGFFHDLHADHSVINICVPYVGTVLYDEMKTALQQFGVYTKGEEGLIHTSEIMQRFWRISDETLDMYFALEGKKDDAQFRKYVRKVVDRERYFSTKEIVYCENNADEGGDAYAHRDLS